MTYAYVSKSVKSAYKIIKKYVRARITGGFYMKQRVFLYIFAL